MHSEFEIEVTLGCWHFSVTNVVLIRSVVILQLKFCMQKCCYKIIYNFLVNLSMASVK